MGMIPPERALARPGRCGCAGGLCLRCAEREVAFSSTHYQLSAHEDMERRKRMWRVSQGDSYRDIMNRAQFGFVGADEPVNGRGFTSWLGDRGEDGNV